MRQILKVMVATKDVLLKRLMLLLIHEDLLRIRLTLHCIIFIKNLYVQWLSIVIDCIPWARIFQVVSLALIR